MKKLLIFLFAFVLMLSLVSAIPPVQTTTSVGSSGIDVEYSNYDIAKQGSAFRLFTHAFNISDGNILTITEADCNLHLYNSTGHEILDEDFAEINGHEFYIDINSSIFNDLGLHSYIIHCNATGIGGFASGNYFVTNSGLEYSDTGNIAMLIAIIFLLLTGGLFFVGFIKEDKMQVKWSLFIIGFLFLLAGLNVISIMVYDNITSTALISFFDSFTGIMFIVFWIVAGLLAVMWFLTLLQALLFNKSVKQSAKFGGMMQ